MNIKAIIAAMGLAVFGLTGVSNAQVIGGDYNIQGSMNDVEVVAGDFNVTGNVDGDIEAIAGDIDIDANVTGDVELVGGDINIAGTIDGHLEVGGGDVDIDASVGGSIEAVGGHVSFGGHAQSSVEMAGGHVEVEVDAVIDGHTELAAEEVVIAGTINGDVEVMAAHLIIRDTAVVNGLISLKGPNEAEIADGAQLAHGVDYTFMEFEFGLKHILEELDIDMDVDNPLGIIILILGFVGLAFFASAFVLGVVAILVSPKGVTRVTQAFRRRPAVSGLLGLIVLAMLPITLGMVTGILAITVIGLPLAGLLWIAYGPMHYLAFTLGVIAFGDLMFNRNGKTGRLGVGTRILSLFVAAVILSALAFIPPLGIFIGFLVLCVGLGAWTLAIFDKPRKDDDQDDSRSSKKSPVDETIEDSPSVDDTSSNDDNPVR